MAKKRDQEFSLDRIVLDFDTISAQDIWDFQKHSGGLDLQAFTDQLQSGEISSENYLSHLRPMVAFIWICARKEHPGLTMKTVAKLPMAQLFVSVVQAEKEAVAATPIAKPPTAAERRAARAAAAVPADS